MPTISDRQEIEYLNQGFRGFWRGSYSTVIRDVIFGGVFSLRNSQFPPHPSTEISDIGHAERPYSLRNSGRPKRESRALSSQIAINFASCVVATFLSSPLNFARN